MKVKVCFNNEIHRISKLPDTYKAFIQLLSTIFHSQLPKNWTLQYVDSDDDKIIMTDDKDYEEFKTLDSQDSNAAIKIFVVSVEDFKGAVAPANKKEEIVEKVVEDKQDEDYQVIENFEASVKVEEKAEESQQEEQKPVVEEVVAEVPVDNKVIDVVPEEQEVEEKKEVPQQVEKEEEKKEEKVENYASEPKPKEEVPIEEEKKEVVLPEVKENKALVDVADIGKMIENLIQDKMPQVTEVLKQQFDAHNIPFTESVIIDRKDKILPEEVLKPLKPEVFHYGIKCNGCQVMPIVGIRYKCTVCPDFNLCAKCEDMEEHEHNFVKMRQRDLLDVFKPQVRPEVQICPVNYPGLNDNDFPKLESKPVVPKKEEKHGDAYFKNLNEKAKKLQKCFPKEDFDMLCVYINDCPEDMTIEELVENYKH